MKRITKIRSSDTYIISFTYSQALTFNSDYLAAQQKLSKITAVQRQVDQLSQPNRAAACVSFGKNISAKSVHLTSLYHTALTSTNDHLTVCMFVLNAKLCNI